MVLGKHTRSDNVGHGMLSSTLESTQDKMTSGMTHCRITSGVAMHHRDYASTHGQTTSAWQAIIALGQHMQGRTTSGVACNNRPWTSYTVGKSWAWHPIIAL